VLVAVGGLVGGVGHVDEGRFVGWGSRVLQRRAADQAFTNAAGGPFGSAVGNLVPPVC
jgi:hypothetical protein